MRILVAVALLAGGCSLDFDALERGRRDAGGLDARVPDRDASLDAGGDSGAIDAGNDAATPCSAADCANAACAGAACDDGLRCTMDDVCSAGVCQGSPVVCPSDSCSAQVCTETEGCTTTASVPDGTPCAAGACCFGACTSLHDSNCGGCGLSCDEESCSPESPPTCVCVTDAGCPRGQTCTSGRCVCTTSSQCATGQTCTSGRCIY